MLELLQHTKHRAPPESTIAANEVAVADLSPVFRPAHDALDLECIQSAPEFDRIESEWSDLVEQSNAEVFQTFAWMRLWWKHYGADKTLHIVLFRQHRTLVGIAPFFIDTTSTLGKLSCRYLRFLGSAVKSGNGIDNSSDYGPSDYLDIVVLPECEGAVAARLAGYLIGQQAGFDVIDLNEISEASVIWRKVVPEIRRKGCSYQLLSREICPRLTVPASVEAFMKGLRPKVRYQLAQSRRAAVNGTTYNITDIEAEEQLDQAYVHFVRLHQQRWNRAGYPGAFADERYRSFLNEVLHVFLQRGWLWFKSAHSNGSFIAHQCAFRFKDRIYDYLKAFDDESPFAKYRPGRALLLLIIEQAIMNKCRVVDFLRGGEPYKFELTSAGSLNWRLIIHHPASRRHLRFQLYRVLGGFLAITRRIAREGKLIRFQARHWGRRAFFSRYPRFVKKRIMDRVHDVRLTLRYHARQVSKATNGVHGDL